MSFRLFAMVLVSLVASANRPASGQRDAPLRYDWKPAQEFTYKAKIVVDLPDPATPVTRNMPRRWSASVMSGREAGTMRCRWSWLTTEALRRMRWSSFVSDSRRKALNTASSRTPWRGSRRRHRR